MVERIVSLFDAMQNLVRTPTQKQENRFNASHTRMEKLQP